VNVTTVIVGAGQAGLAMSHCLTQRGIDHVVLERGRIAERWQSERWDSLRLLTPNWMTRLPGYSYQGNDPDGFMTMREVARFFADYARVIDAPVLDETTVVAARRTTEGYRLDTTRGTITCRTVVAATGACAIPAIPMVATAAPARLFQITPKHYRRPDQLPAGGVLVVGASASGVQLARELHESGRPVTLAVGRHTRIPRRYRGLDIHEWFDLMGTLDRRHDTVRDLDAARREPSLQLVGSGDGRSLDLTELKRIGVRLAGRVERFDSGSVRFSGSLAADVAAADEAQTRLLDRIDGWATANGLDREIDPISRPAAVDVGREPGDVDLGSAGINSVLWATGYRPDYSWLDLPLVRPDGTIPHDGGIVTGSPGLYLMGLPVMRTRKSTFIDGVAADAEALSAHLAAGLGASRRTADDTVMV
jgi:putative flavoprotein involved in K+ transport